MIGTIKQIFKDKNFGFITADGKDYFFHKGAIKNARFEDLERGQEVQFEDAESDNGLRAEDIYV